MIIIKQRCRMLHKELEKWIIIEHFLFIWAIVI